MKVIGGGNGCHGLEHQPISTMAAVALRTSGRTRSRVGKAKIHDIPHALIQILGMSGDSPTPLIVLIIETTKVMSMDSNSGITHAAQRAGSFGKPRKDFLGRLDW